MDKPKPVTKENEYSVEIGDSVNIGHFNDIIENTVIKDCANIYNLNTIQKTKIYKNANVKSSQITGSVVGENANIGVFSHLRGESLIGVDVKVGSFVETKKCIIKNKTKVPHLSYVGDAVVGEGCNVGCGVIFCNYDGKKKYVTTVKDGVFIGANTNLVAPVILGEKSFIAAGSTITQDVPPYALAIARARQLNKEDYKKINPSK